MSSLTSLHTIYFVQNKISHITGLDQIGATLRSLELGGNRIRVSISLLVQGMQGRDLIHDIQKIEGLDALVYLEELWLGKNKITKFEVHLLVSIDLLRDLPITIVELEYPGAFEDPINTIEPHHED